MSSRRPLYLALSVVVARGPGGFGRAGFHVQAIGRQRRRGRAHDPRPRLPSVSRRRIGRPRVNHRSRSSPEPAPTSTGGSLGDTDSGLAARSRTRSPAASDPAELTGYIWPIRNSLITGRDSRRASFGGFVIIDGQGVHDGLDLATHCGDKVRAAHDGTVLYAGRNFDPYLGYWGDANADLRSPRAARAASTSSRSSSSSTTATVIGACTCTFRKRSSKPGTVVEAGDVIGLEGDDRLCDRLPPPLHDDPHGRRLAADRPAAGAIRLSAARPRADRSVEGSAMGRSERAAAAPGPGQSTVADTVHRARRATAPSPAVPELQRTHSMTTRTAHPGAWSVTTTSTRLRLTIDGPLSRRCARSPRARPGGHRHRPDHVRVAARPGCRRRSRLC